MWDVDANPIRELATFSGATGFLRAALSGDGHRAAAATETAIIVWDVLNASEVFRVKQSNRLLADLALAPDGSQLAVAGSDGPITLWNIPSGLRAHILRPNSSAFTRLVYAPRGQRLVAETGNQITLWDSAAGRQIFLKEMKPRSTPRIAVFNPDGRRVAAIDEKRVARLWNAENGEDQRSFETIGVGDGSIAFSPDGKKLAASLAGELAVALWDTETGRRTRAFSLARSPVINDFPDGDLAPHRLQPGRFVACSLPGTGRQRRDQFSVGVDLGREDRGRSGNSSSRSPSAFCG